MGMFLDFGTAREPSLPTPPGTFPWPLHPSQLPLSFRYPEKLDLDPEPRVRVLDSRCPPAELDKLPDVSREGPFAISPLRSCRNLQFFQQR